MIDFIDWHNCRPQQLLQVQSIFTQTSKNILLKCLRFEFQAFPFGRGDCCERGL